MKKNTLFSKFLLVIMALTFILVAITILSLIYQKKNKKLYELREQTQNLKTSFYHDNLLINSFIIQDLIDTNFYKTKESPNIFLHDSLISFIRTELNNIEKSNQIDEAIRTIIKKIDIQIVAYTNTIDSIVKISLLRGFKDYGYIGLMREQAHKLEHINDFEKYKVLMLRRHEKDYLIRDQLKYVQLFRDKCSLYTEQIVNYQMSESKKKTLIENLNMYLFNFNKIVKLDLLLGIKTNTGLTADFRNKRLKLQNNITLIIKEVDSCITKSEQNLKLYYYLLSFMLILISFVSGLLIVNHLTRPISNLSKNIKYFVDSNFKETKNFVVKTDISEIITLANNYLSMQNEILILLNDFQREVKNRTEEVEVQKETIKAQKLKVEKINQNIVDSIKYAKQIQNAMLPANKTLSDNFAKHFVIFKPRDLVSGDFLWFKRIKNTNFNLKLIAIADCTGHGVPAAMLSMLSIAYLNEIALRKDIVHSNKILDKLRLKFVNNFKYDGLDIAFIIIDVHKKILEYSGANRNIYIKTKDNFYKIKGNKMPIGQYPYMKNFDRHCFKYNDGDIIFAFTDGISSQLNSKGHTLGTKKIVEIINKTAKFEHLKDELMKVHYSKGIETQTDDILFFAGML